MDNMDEALGKLLSDPNTMAQIASLAKSIGGSPPPEQMPDSPAEGRHIALFQALKPFLSPSRRLKLEKAMQLAKLSTFAGSAMRLNESAQEGR